jgi:hypothetical protein
LWLLKTLVQERVSKEALLGSIQAAIEGVVLTQENGSLPQRVLAEFLAEMVSRVEAAGAVATSTGATAGGSASAGGL